MAVARVQGASHTYHVFLSFRGADTRKNFTDHLYAALVQAGIHTFRDENEIEKGENIRDEIQRAMLQKSKISLIVLSKNYASSTWCLDELVKIMEHRKSSQHIVLPIFYDVNPSEVRFQTGSFAEAFAKHEDHFKSKREIVQRWRAVLREVAELGGMVLEDRHEAHFLQNIVEEVQNKLHRSTSALHVTPYLVGMDYLVKRINWWLEDGSDKVGMATICGIGGIGKTTIAKVVYNQNIQRFEGYSFIADVREVYQERNGLVRLQRQLISDILKGKVNKMYNADDGIIKIKEALCCRKVLLVFDDVDDLEKVAKIIGTRIPLHPGSKIILTSRQRYLLRKPFVTQMFDLEVLSSYRDFCKIFEVKELAFNESLRLFNWYAFGHSSTIDSCMEYARSIVKHCSGLPLALQVLGSSLSGKGIKVWQSALEKLEAIPESKVQKILRISYDSLQDDHDRNLFLDIACFFIGKDRDYTTTILDGCDFYTEVGIENLIDRSLLFVNEKNKLIMHQLVRDMGREIICQESPEPGKRSRLWRRDAYDVLRDKTGTKRVRSLTLDTFGKSTTSQHLGYNSKSQFLMSNKVSIETEAFVQMHRLKLLQLDYAKLEGEYRDFPKGLIWLRWHGFHLQSLPTAFDIKRLVALDLRNSSLKHVWKEATCLPNLKILNLSHSHRLVKTPNFSGLPNLERLMLKDCIKLIEVDQSIGELKRLTLLNLKGCISVRKLPRTIGMLVSLEQLILSGCSRLDDVPRELKNMKSLTVLNLDETAINQSSLWLPWLPLKKGNGLCLFWPSLPYSLVELSLDSCRLSDEVMPNDLNGLVSLKSLNLSRNLFHRVPESIGDLIMLDELVLTSCTELQVIPKLPIFNLVTGPDVAMSPLSVAFSSLCHLFSLKTCIIFGCEKLIEVEGVFKLEPIESYEVEQIKSLFNIDYVESQKVQIYNCLTDTRIVSSLQVLHECGITSSFVCGSAVPISFEHRSKGPQIAFSLPLLSPGEKISCLKLGIVFSLASDQILPTLPSVSIFNETKEIMWTYMSSFIGIPETNNNTMLWLIHWPTKDFLLEGGDCVICTIVPVDFDVREFGVSCGSENNIGYDYGSQHYYPGNNDVHLTRRNIEFEQIANLFDSFGNVKVQSYSYLEDSKAINIARVLYDCGIILEFDRSKYISFYHYCHHQAPRPKVSFIVPPNSSQNISWLKSIFILSSDNDKTFEFLPRVEIVNETKGTSWSHCEHFVGFGDTKNTIIWFSSWKFRGEIEAGDHVSFMLLSDLRIIKCDIDLVYEDETVVTSAVGKTDSVDFYLRGRPTCSDFVLGPYMYHLFKTQRSLYRMQSLVKD